MIHSDFSFQHTLLRWWLLIQTGGWKQKLIPLKGYSLDLILSNEGVPTVLSFEPVCDAASGSAVQKMVWPWSLAKSLSVHNAGSFR